MKLPIARTEKVVVQNLRYEVLIYDLATDRAFCLNETAGKVFNGCDGKQTFADLKSKYKFTDDLIHFALDELQKNNLLADYTSEHFKGMSRRKIIKRVGLASIIALPVIAGMTAPVAASAASVCTTGSGPSDPNGREGKGDVCYCSVNGNTTYPPCNTTRGGDGTTSVTGCKQGCLCRVTDPATQCRSNGACDTGFARCG